MVNWEPWSEYVKEIQSNFFKTVSKMNIKWIYKWMVKSNKFLNNV